MFFCFALETHTQYEGLFPGLLFQETLEMGILMILTKLNNCKDHWFWTNDNCCNPAFSTQKKPTWWKEMSFCKNKNVPLRQHKAICRNYSFLQKGIF